jgi:hypothetical protein
MKKKMIILAVVAVTCVIGAVAVVCKMRNLERNVTFDVVTEKGSVGAADGLRISFVQYPEIPRGVDEDGYYEEIERLNDHQWKSTLKFTANGVDTTNEMISNTKSLLAEEKKKNEEAVFLAEAVNNTWGEYKIEGLSLDYRMEKYLPEEFSASLREEYITGLGKDTQVTRPLTDFIEYYPMFSYIRFPDCGDEKNYNSDKDGRINIRERGNLIETTKDYEEQLSYYVSGSYAAEYRYEEVMRVAKGFEEFFRIPVLKNDIWEFGYGKNPTREETEDSEPEFWWRCAENSDRFIPYYVYVTTHDAMYFTFLTHTENGALADTSLIPGGYGIYRLPYRLDYESGTTSILIDELRMFSPLDPKIQIMDVSLSGDEKTMLILYWLNQEYRVRVIDLATGGELYDGAFVIGADSASYTKVDYGEDFFAVSIRPKMSSLVDLTQYSGEEREEIYRMKKAEQEGLAVLCVFGKNASGVYGELMRSNAYMDNAPSCCAFDGERLAVVDHIGGGYFWVYVYSANGLIYEGRVTNSLIDAAEMSSIDYDHSWGRVAMWDIRCCWE